MHGHSNNSPNTFRKSLAKTYPALLDSEHHVDPNCRPGVTGHLRNDMGASIRIYTPVWTRVIDKRPHMLDLCPIIDNTIFQYLWSYSILDRGGSSIIRKSWTYGDRNKCYYQVLTRQFLGGFQLLPPPSRLL